MLRPFSARQLHLVAGDGRVVAFAVLGDRRRGPSVDVHVPTLLRRMRDLAPDIDTVVFFDEPVPDGALVALIDDMVDAFTERDCDALAVGVTTTEAVKWVEDDRVVSAVDRARLVTVRCPEVVRRAVLDRALSHLTDQTWVNPTELVVAAGAGLHIYDPVSRTPVDRGA
jgi:hypothetical protein